MISDQGRVAADGFDIVNSDHQDGKHNILDMRIYVTRYCPFTAVSRLLGGRFFLQFRPVGWKCLPALLQIGETPISRWRRRIR